VSKVPTFDARRRPVASLPADSVLLQPKDAPPSRYVKSVRKGDEEVSESSLRVVDTPARLTALQFVN